MGIFAKKKKKKASFRKGRKRKKQKKQSKELQSCKNRFFPSVEIQTSVSRDEISLGPSKFMPCWKLLPSHIG